MLSRLREFADNILQNQSASILNRTMFNFDGFTDPEYKKFLEQNKEFNSFETFNFDSTVVRNESRETDDEKHEFDKIKQYFNSCHNGTDKVDLNSYCKSTKSSENSVQYFKSAIFLIILFSASVAVWYFGKFWEKRKKSKKKDYVVPEEIIDNFNSNIPRKKQLTNQYNCIIGKFLYKLADEKIDGGDGNFSITYKGTFEDQDHGGNPHERECAIKVLNLKNYKLPQQRAANETAEQFKDRREEAMLNRDNALRRFLVECEISLKSLNKSNPNVLKYYGAFFPTKLDIENMYDLPCLVSAYMEGGNMKKYLANCENFTVKNALDYTEQLADGLDYLHSIHVYHGDLACRNLLLTKNSADRTVQTDFVLKIADFGLSGTSTEYTNYNSKMPKDHMQKNPGYAIRWASPEVRSSCMQNNVNLKSTTITDRSDVWSFAVTVWEMFTKGETPEKFTSHQLIHERIRLSKPGYCPNAMYLLLMRCWQTDFENRPDIRIVNKLLKKMILSHYNQIGITDEDMSKVIDPIAMDRVLIESTISKINMPDNENNTSKLNNNRIDRECKADPSLLTFGNLKRELKYFIYPSPVENSNVVEYNFYRYPIDNSFSNKPSKQTSSSQIGKGTSVISEKYPRLPSGYVNDTNENMNLLSESTSQTTEF